MITTTLNRILAHDPCGQRPMPDGTLKGWLKLLAHLGKTEADDEPLTYAVIVQSNSLDDALWCTRAEPDRPEWIMLARRYALDVIHLWDSPVPQVVMNYLTTGDASLRAAARAAAGAGAAAWPAAWPAARAAAWAAAESGGDAAWAAAWAAAQSGGAAAWAAAWAAAESGGDAAWLDASDRQTAQFLEVVR